MASLHECSSKEIKSLIEATREELCDGRKAAEAEAQRIRDEISSIQKQMEELEKQLPGLHSERNALEQEKQKLQAQLQEKEADIEVTERINQIEITHMRREVCELRTATELEISNKDDLIPQINEANQILQNETLLNAARIRSRSRSPGPPPTNFDQCEEMIANEMESQNREAYLQFVNDPRTRAQFDLANQFPNMSNYGSMEMGNPSNCPESPVGYGPILDEQVIRPPEDLRAAALVGAHTYGMTGRERLEYLAGVRQRRSRFTRPKTPPCAPDLKFMNQIPESFPSPLPTPPPSPSFRAFDSPNDLIYFSPKNFMDFNTPPPDRRLSPRNYEGLRDMRAQLLPAPHQILAQNGEDCCDDFRGVAQGGNCDLMGFSPDRNPLIDFNSPPPVQPRIPTPPRIPRYPLIDLGSPGQPRMPTPPRMPSPTPVELVNPRCPTPQEMQNLMGFNTPPRNYRVTRKIPDPPPLPDCGPVPWVRQNRNREEVRLERALTNVNIQNNMRNAFQEGLDDINCDEFAISDGELVENVGPVPRGYNVEDPLNVQEERAGRHIVLNRYRNILQIPEIGGDGIMAQDYECIDLANSTGDELYNPNHIPQIDLSSNFSGGGLNDVQQNIDFSPESSFNVTPPQPPSINTVNSSVGSACVEEERALHRVRLNRYRNMLQQQSPDGILGQNYEFENPDSTGNDLYASNRPLFLNSNLSGGGLSDLPENFNCDPDSFNVTPLQAIPNSPRTPPFNMRIPGMPGTPGILDQSMGSSPRRQHNLSFSPIFDYANPCVDSFNMSGEGIGAFGPDENLANESIVSDDWDLIKWRTPPNANKGRVNIQPRDLTSTVQNNNRLLQQQRLHEMRNAANRRINGDSPQNCGNQEEIVEERMEDIVRNLAGNCVENGQQGGADLMGFSPDKRPFINFDSPVRQVTPPRARTPSPVKPRTPPPSPNFMAHYTPPPLQHPPYRITRNIPDPPPLPNYNPVPWTRGDKKTREEICLEKALTRVNLQNNMNNQFQEGIDDIMNDAFLINDDDLEDNNLPRLPQWQQLQNEGPNDEDVALHRVLLCRYRRMLQNLSPNGILGEEYNFEKTNSTGNDLYSSNRPLFLNSDLSGGGLSDVPQNFNCSPGGSFNVTPPRPPSPANIDKSGCDEEQIALHRVRLCRYHNMLQQLSPDGLLGQNYDFENLDSTGDDLYASNRPLFLNSDLSGGGLSDLPQNFNCDPDSFNVSPLHATPNSPRTPPVNMRIPGMPGTPGILDQSMGSSPRRQHNLSFSPIIDYANPCVDSFNISGDELRAFDNDLLNESIISDDWDLIKWRSPPNSHLYRNNNGGRAEVRDLRDTLHQGNQLLRQETKRMNQQVIQPDNLMGLHSPPQMARINRQRGNARPLTEFTPGTFDRDFNC